MVMASVKPTVWNTYALLSKINKTEMHNIDGYKEFV